MRAARCLMQHSPPTPARAVALESAPGNPHAPLPYCLACGYERAGLSEATVCPECGAMPTADARELVELAFRRPLRRAVNVIVGRFELGWWCLLPARLRIAARVQMVLFLTIATVALAAFFLIGAHVRVYIAFTPDPMRPPSGGIEYMKGENAILGGLVRGDMGWNREPGAIPIEIASPLGEPPIAPRLEFLRPSMHPIVIASAMWAACLPAAGLLGLRFVLLPLTLRLMRRSLTPQTRTAAAIAADASVAATAIACAALTIAAAVLSFLLALALPLPAAAALIRATPATILALLVALPPLLFTGAIRSDRARRVFAWPAAAAVTTFAGYFVGIALGAAVTAATFLVATRAFS